MTDGARRLGVTRQAFDNRVSGKAGTSPGMAIRLDKVFDGGAEFRLQRQLVFDLLQARASVLELSIDSLQQKALLFRKRGLQVVRGCITRLSPSTTGYLASLQRKRCGND